MRLPRLTICAVHSLALLTGCSSLLDLPQAFDDSAGSGGKETGGTQSNGGTPSAETNRTTAVGGGGTGGSSEPSRGGAGGSTLSAVATASSGTGGEMTGSSPSGGAGGGSASGGATSSSNSAPSITSFTAQYNKVCTGSVAILRAEFSNGNGTIDNGIGAITSGTTKTSGPITTNTTFKLTVANGNGEKVEATVDVGVLPGGKFTRTGDLLKGRHSHTATRLSDGRVLIAGGVGAYQDAELYDPNTGKFSSAGRMLNERSLHTATLLPDGRVLLVGSAQAAEIFLPPPDRLQHPGSSRKFDTLILRYT
ncbi:MAG: hypothetical protein QM784_01900 [Polyangiaceae bacterium]